MGKVLKWLAIGVAVVITIAAGITLYVNTFPVEQRRVMFEVAPPRVFDCQGVERSWEWLEDKYPGVRYLRSEEKRAFRLVTVRETCGPASVVVRVYGEDAEPSQNYVGLYWPEPEKPISTDGAVDRWYDDVGALQYTNEDGHTGFGLGSGSVVHDDGGPHAVWVLSGSVGSDALDKFGWLGGTDHWCPCSLDFQLQTVDITPTATWTSMPTWTPVPVVTATGTPTKVPTVTATPEPKSWYIHGDLGGIPFKAWVEEE